MSFSRQFTFWKMEQPSGDMDFRSILNYLITCKRDIMEKGKDSVYYKEMSDHHFVLSALHQPQHINNEKLEFPIDIETFQTDFSSLKESFQNLDETCQELQYQNTSLRKQNEKQKLQLQEFLKRTIF